MVRHCKLVRSNRREKRIHVSMLTPCLLALSFLRIYKLTVLNLESVLRY